MTREREKYIKRLTTFYVMSKLLNRKIKFTKKEKKIICYYIRYVKK